jgi:hypothetical protein
MITLFQWLFVHLLGDFVFQTPRMVRHKKQWRTRSWVLYVHCLLHGAMVYAITGAWSLWYIPLIVVVTHYIIDLWKLHRPETALYFIIDQLLHMLVLFALWCVFIAPAGLQQQIATVLKNQAAWAIGSGYLFVTLPLSFLLSLATQRWRRQAEEGGMRSSFSLNEAGKWIGIFERILVYTFVITNHFEGIGFLIAAKSILRFNDIKGSEACKEAEYVLIGTLMSFSISILTGLLVRSVI